MLLCLSKLYLFARLQLQLLQHPHRPLFAEIRQVVLLLVCLYVIIVVMFVLYVSCILYTC